MRRLANVKKMSGEILATTEVTCDICCITNKLLKKCPRQKQTNYQIFEKKPKTIKNFGVWIRYDSRSGTHNMYKEYRELTRADAISACYLDLASRHRARFSNVHIIKVAEVAGEENVKRVYTKQFLVKFFFSPKASPISTNIFTAQTRTPRSSSPCPTVSSAPPRRPSTPSSRPPAPTPTSSKRVSLFPVWRSWPEL